MRGGPRSPTRSRASLKTVPAWTYGQLPGALLCVRLALKLCDRVLAWFLGRSPGILTSASLVIELGAGEVQLCDSIRESGRHRVWPRWNRGGSDYERCCAGCAGGSIDDAVVCNEGNAGGPAIMLTDSEVGSVALCAHNAQLNGSSTDAHTVLLRRCIL